MIRPITITDEIKERMKKEFAEYIDSHSQMMDGKFSYEKVWKWNDDQNATIIVSEIAERKMRSLVNEFSDEVAWHGTARRAEDNDNVFYIDDIFVYPQEVSGATVNTDQEKYQNWLFNLDDEIFNHIRFQGHSHVNMSVTPSAVDLDHQEMLLNQLGPEDYYIFTIQNKKGNYFWKIFDRKTNTLYENESINVFIPYASEVDEFMQEAKKNVVKKSYVTPSNKAASKNAGYPWNRKDSEYYNSKEWKDYYDRVYGGGYDEI